MINFVIVEDEFNIREQVKSALSSEKDILISGSHGTAEDFLKNLNSFPKEDTVVLMDLGLPKMGGIQAIFEARKTRKDLAFVVYTKFADDENLFDAMAVGATTYVLKEEPLAELYQSLIDANKKIRRMNMFIAQQLENAQRNRRDKNYEAWFKFNDKQKNILNLFANNLSSKEIACNMDISLATLNYHIDRIYAICGSEDERKRKTLLSKIFTR
jgi:NarL family two-component system response regulator LiaR